jgi:Raf kinase inhibitor-like YbhB/YbcL family protein
VSAATPGGPLRLSSSAFKNNGAIPRENTCQGANQSLPLAWTIPRGTVSLALRMQDVDTDQQFVHWLVYGIKPQTTSVAAGQPPPGSVQAKNSFGNAQYTGPCPPLGQRHRYVFTLLALATDLQVSNDVSPADLWAALERSAVVGKVELTGTYQRPEPGPPANSG